MSHGPAVERGRLRQPGDRVLAGGIGRRVRTRHVRGNRAVVDDAAAPGILALHHRERLLRAEERAGEIDVDDRAPLVDGELVNRHAAGAGAGVVEEEIEAPEGARGGLEQRANRVRVGDVGRHGQRACPINAGLACRLLRAAPGDARPGQPRSLRPSRPMATARPMPLPAPVTRATFDGVFTPRTLTWVGHAHRRHRRRGVPRSSARQRSSSRAGRAAAGQPHHRRRHQPARHRRPARRRSSRQHHRPGVRPPRW